MLKYASLAAAVAARSGYQCADRKQWADCVLAYANGECGSNIGECDRTCNRCQSSENICFDMIPPNHNMYYDLGQPVRSEWPTASNSGGNSFPRKLDEETDSYFPFDPANVSKFCLDVFENRMCDNDDLHLTYDAGQSYERVITLAGKAYEYCRFTCGYCKQNTPCYTNHNEGMKFLSRPVEAAGGVGGGLDEFDWGSFESFDFSDEGADEESDDSSDGWGDSWGASDDEWGSDSSDDSWGASDDSWGGSWGWRKKRDLQGLNKADVLKSAVQNIVSHLEHGMELNPKMKVMALSRKKRQSWSMYGQSHTQEYEERKRYSDMIDTCWITMDNDDMAEGEEPEEEEEEVFEGEEGEENGNYIDQITERRAELDNVGINNYYSNLKKEDDASLGACSYFPMPYGEPDMYMQLTYVCGVSCGDHEAPFAYNPMHGSSSPLEFNEESGIFELYMTCERKHKGMKPKEPSDCESTGLTRDLRIICQEIEAEEAEEVEYESEGDSELSDELSDYYANNFMFY